MAQTVVKNQRNIPIENLGKTCFLKNNSDVMTDIIRRKIFFTLVELLIVIAVISILCSVLLPALKKAKDFARTAQCQSNQRQCGFALSGYANDFDAWIIGGGVTEDYVEYTTLGKMMIALNYANVKTSSMALLYPKLNFGAVFQCPSTPPPKDYKEWFGSYTPSSKYNCSVISSYGLRHFTKKSYFPGEKISTAHILIKYPSLYQPSIFPYMVDTITPVNNTSNTYVGGTTQFFKWYLSGGGWTPQGFCGALHLRHNRHANVWCPDGHVEKWNAQRALEFKVPNAGTMGTVPLGYKN